jgi:hypothetical protein
MVSRIGVGALLVAASLTLASAAHADVSASDRETARTLMAEGDKKRESGDLTGALKAFQQADTIMNVPTTGLEVARVQVRLGKLLEARDTLARVIRIPVSAGEPGVFATARKTAETLNAELGERVPGVRIKVIGADPGVEPQIAVDGETVPSSIAAPRKLNPGAHEVVVTSGAVERRQSFTLAERETRDVSVDLSPAAPPPPPDETGPKGAGPGKALMYGGFGVGAVGLAVGSITGLMSISKVSSIREGCVDNRCPPEKQSDIDSAKSLGTVSTVAFIVGGVGVGVGIVGLVMTSSDKPTQGQARARKSVAVAPEVGLGWVGLRGAF